MKSYSLEGAIKKFTLIMQTCLRIVTWRIKIQCKLSNGCSKFVQCQTLPLFPFHLQTQFYLKVKK